MEESHADEVRSAYDSAAEYYDRFVSDGLSQNALAEEPYVQTLLEPLLAGKEVLDLCCGSGRYSLWMAERGASVTAVDNSRRLLEIATEKACNAGLSIRFVEADLNEPSSFTGSFDGILIGMGIGYFADLDALFKAISDCMKPGAWIVISTNHPVREAGGYIHDPVLGTGRSVFNYFSREPFYRVWRHLSTETGESFRVPVYRHTIESVAKALSGNSILLDCILEPEPIMKPEMPREILARMTCCPQFILYKGIKTSVCGQNRT